MNPDELASIAAQLVGRVRDDDPDANGRWLCSVTDETDRWALLFVLAAAVPDHVPWGELTMWTYGTGGLDTPETIARRRLTLDMAMGRRYGRRKAVPGVPTVPTREVA